MATAAPKHDRSKTAIIVGASRGLGLGLAREFARRGWHVTATARNASIAPELADVAAASDGRIEVEEVDIDLAESVDALATRLAGRRFNLVFINAGIAGPPHQSVDAVTPQEIGVLMYTNADRPSPRHLGLIRSQASKRRNRHDGDYIGSVEQCHHDCRIGFRWPRAVWEAQIWFAPLL
jgi:NAD(P)-dependent dehydrogenase (short-subunit alcohol dehydrogenase family)